MRATSSENSEASAVTFGMVAGSVWCPSTLANGNRGARLRVDDHTILNVRIRTDEDGLHLAVFIDFVRSDHCIGPDENIFVYDNSSTENGGRIDKRTVMDDWHVASWVFADHLDFSTDVMICMT